MKSEDIALKVIKGTTFLLFSEIVIFIFNSTYKILSARYLGPDNFGKLSLIMILISISSFVFLLGIPAATTKYISSYLAKEKDAKMLFKTALSFTAISALVASSFVFIISEYISIALFHNSNATILIRISSLSILFAILGALLNNSFMGFLRIDYSALMNATNSIVLVTSLAVILFLGYGLNGAVTCILLASISTTTLGFILIRRIINPWPCPCFDIAIFQSLLKFSLPLFMASTVELILSWADSFLIGLFLDATSVGYYSVVLTIMSLIGILNRPLNTAIYPVISEAHAKKDQHGLSLILNYSIKFDFYLAIACSVGGAILAEPLIRIIFGEEFLPGVTALKIIAFGAAFQSLRVVGTKYFAGIGEPNIGMNFIIVSAAVDLLLNIILIPKYGITGAAIATSVSYFIMVILSYRYIQTKIKISLDFIPKCFIASCFMAIIIFITMQTGVNSILKLASIILIGATSYFICLYIIHGFSKEELALIKRYLHKNKS